MRPGRPVKRGVDGTTEAVAEPAVRPGMVLRIPEEHYLYGVGVLVLRVTVVGAAVRLPDDVWLPISGVELTRSGADWRERTVLVRLSTLPRL